VTPTETFKKPKVFLIKKYVKYEEIIKEFCGDDENNSDTERKIKKNKIPPGKRIKLIKYNNKKLSNLEKVEKLKILSKVVRRYRRKIKNIRRKIKQNSEKIWEKYLSKKIVKKKKNSQRKEKEERNFSLGNLITSLKKVGSHETAEYSEDGRAIENLVSLIASGKLRPDSIQFKKIATQIRMLMSEDKVKVVNKEQRVSVKFPEREVFITKKELEFYRKAGGEEPVYRAILGLRPNVEDDEDMDMAPNKGIYDRVLEGLMSKNIVDSDEFCNNLFNTDIANCNNVFIK